MAPYQIPTWEPILIHVCVFVFFSWVNFPMVEIKEKNDLYEVFVGIFFANVVIFWKKKSHVAIFRQ
jgi:hypothetical protein